MRNLFAFTDRVDRVPGGYVPYISVNEQDDGTVTIDVRPAGTADGAAVRIVMTRDAAERMAQGILT